MEREEEGRVAGRGAAAISRGEGRPDDEEDDRPVRRREKKKGLHGNSRQ